MSPLSFERIDQCWFNSSKVSKVVKKLIEENGSLKNYNASCFENTPLFAVKSLFENSPLIEESCLIQNTWIRLLKKTIISGKALTVIFRKKSEAGLQASGKRPFLFSEGPVW